MQRDSILDGWGYLELITIMGVEIWLSGSKYQLNNILPKVRSFRAACSGPGAQAAKLLERFESSRTYRDRAHMKPT